jgi:hypothetical protein
MSKIFQQFNIVEPIRTKTFLMNGHTFKVNVPLSTELDKMLERIALTSPDTVKKRLTKMTTALTESPVEGVEVKDDDVLVDGKSTKDVVVSVLQMENRITEYFKLLIPEEGTMDDITYEDIDAEFPLQVQLEIVEKITEAIQPGYKEARKN